MPAPAPAMKEQRPPMSSEQAECMARLKTYLLSTEPRVGFTKPSGKPVLAQREVVEKVADEAAELSARSAYGPNSCVAAPSLSRRFTVPCSVVRSSVSRLLRASSVFRTTSPCISIWLL